MKIIDVCIPIPVTSICLYISDDKEMAENYHAIGTWLVHNHSLSLYPLCCTDAKDENYRSPLHWACSERHLDVVKYLVNNANCDVSELTMNGYVYCVILDVIQKVVKQCQECYH